MTVENLSNLELNLRKTLEQWHTKPSGLVRFDLDPVTSEQSVKNRLQTLSLPTDRVILPQLQDILRDVA